ncbi:MAG TPA: hypothetical protein VGF94_17485 [Kofleriaceae bacterium]|jgi:hypothetical protein
MAGSSATPLVQKLGIEDGHRVALLGAPPKLTDLLGALPAGVTVHARLAGKTSFDVVIAFVVERSALAGRIAAVRPRMTPAAGLWIAWPKRASGIATDMTGDVVRSVALPTGLVDNKVCAIDETWSGLRLVIRRELR